METKTFGNKKITIREFNKNDFKIAKRFLDFINSLIEEDSKLGLNKKLTLKDELTFLNKVADGYKNKTYIYLVAQDSEKIVGATDMHLGKQRQSHVAHFGISIRKEYRGIGLGEYMMKETINLTRKKLKPKILYLAAMANNTPAISLYKKMGYKVIAKVPKMRQYKGKLIAEVIMTKEL